MLLEQTIHVVAPLCSDVIVVLNDAQDWRDLPARLVHDSYPDGGALGGLYSGLSAAACPYALVVAADMPLLNPALLAAMLERPRSYDVLIPRALKPATARNGWQVEPLHAIYSRACVPVLRSALEQGVRRLSDVLAMVRVAVLEPDEIVPYDPYGHSFLNINTPADLASVKCLLRLQHARRGTSEL